MFPLVVVVHADPEVRLRRLIEYRGFSEDDAKARIAAQATDEQRRTVADVWLDNSGSEGELVSEPVNSALVRGSCRFPTTSLRAHRRPIPPRWFRPIRPGPIRAAAPSRGSTPPAGTGHCVSTTSARRPSPEWTPATSSTFRSRSRRWTSPTNSPRICCAPAIRGSGRSLLTATRVVQKPCGPAVSRLGGSRRPTHAHPSGGEPSQRFALLFVDWLNAGPAARAEYLAVKSHGDPGAIGRWFSEATAGLGLGGGHRLVAGSGQLTGSDARASIGGASPGPEQVRASVGRRCRRVRRATAPKNSGQLERRARCSAEPCSSWPRSPGRLWPAAAGAMNWLACTVTWSSTRISQCRLAEYGHWIEIRIPASAGSVSTPVVSNVRPAASSGWRCSPGHR